MPTQTTVSRSPRPLRLALGIALALALGCTGTGSGDADSDTTGETSTGSSNGMSSTSLPMETTGQSAGPTSGETSGDTASSTGVSTTDDTTTDDTTTTTTGDVPSLEETCSAACQNTEGCVPNPFPELESCMWSCTRHDDQSSECVEGLSLYNVCVSEMTCEEYEASLMGQPNPCQELGQQINNICDICPLSILSGDNCGMTQACEGEPKIEYRCTGDTCTCLVDDEKQGECPAADICGADFGTQAEAAKECCGFEF